MCVCVFNRKRRERERERGKNIKECKQQTYMLDFMPNVYSVVSKLKNFNSLGRMKNSIHSVKLYFVYVNVFVGVFVGGCVGAWECVLVWNR